MRRGASLPGRRALEDADDVVLRVLLRVGLGAERNERLAPQPLSAQVVADEAAQLVRVTEEQA